ncbi:MAG: hypothetical protein QW507_01970 [Candidatus Nanoarchaeia archaeon]|nr:hypothetical protein [Candidatus Haiyanarchaeum thermophilum]MCW1302819.1 hypothetical protein [Candidatus Haiyanarchaeum thermophilum]MCW1303500.1 hypothetical protein [Candidatus Haiyanarchaeum thermophilum]MCW1306680.1 hypothetical protein [Candidatus Haiyanarchaeum thermophilum]MCW1307364.1 hypothetical protein [Candidatus Haiyanarchaeum thermophilum]
MSLLRELARELYQVGAVKFGDFVLKSGRKSPYYINLRILSSYPLLLKEVGKAMAGRINSLSEEDKVNRLCGIPAAGLAIANAVGMETGIPVCYTRKEPIIYRDLVNALRLSLREKDYPPERKWGIEEIIQEIERLSGFKTHGIESYVDGELRDGDRIGIVDDLITTAESKLEAKELIELEAKRRGIGVKVMGVFTVLDREQGGKEALEKEGLKLYSLLTIREMAKFLLEDGVLTPPLYRTIVEYTLAERKSLGLG